MRSLVRGSLVPSIVAPTGDFGLLSCPYLTKRRAISDWLFVALHIGVQGLEAAMGRGESRGVVRLASDNLDVAR